MKRQLGSLLLELTRSAPLVLLLEDLHWADASTVDLIAYLADRFDSLHLLLIVTYRPSDLAVAKHPFAEVQLNLQGHGAIRETRLRAFDRQDLIAYLATDYPEHRLPDEFVSLLHARTEGTPLFVVDLMRQLVNRGIVIQRDGVWHLDETLESVEAELPQSIRSVIQRTVDRLDEADRRLLVAASVQGSEFDSAVIAAATQMDNAEVEERLDRLEKIHAIVRFVDERVLARKTPSLRYALRTSCTRTPCMPPCAEPPGSHECRSPGRWRSVTATIHRRYRGWECCTWPPGSLSRQPLVSCRRRGRRRACLRARRRCCSRGTA
jgi:predicted ATPase